MTEQPVDLEEDREAWMIERARATAREYGTVEEALAEYERATGIKITMADLLAGIGRDV